MFKATTIGVLLAVSVWMYLTTSFVQAACIPNMPNVNCSHSIIKQDPLVIWDLCLEGAVTVDIDLGSFGGNQTKIDKIRDRGIAGWNHAFSEPMKRTFFTEVGSSGDVYIADLSDANMDKKPNGKGSAGTHTIKHQEPHEVCCGNICRLKRTKIYTRSSTSNQNFGSLIVHEMGHAFSLKDDSRKSGYTTPSVMSYKEMYGYDWPQAADGESIACMYNSLLGCCP